MIFLTVKSMFITLTFHLTLTARNIIYISLSKILVYHWSKENDDIQNSSTGGASDLSHETG
jgi:hypothetical protein